MTSVYCLESLGEQEVQFKNKDHHTWTVADFESLLDTLPRVQDPGAMVADLAVARASLGEELAVVVICPKFFRHLEAVSVENWCLFVPQG